MACCNICGPGDIDHDRLGIKINTHHIIPAFRGENCQDYRAFFQELGVNPDNWLTDVHRDQHLQEFHYGPGAGVYNDLWASWISENCDKVDAEDVYEFAAQMMEDFNIPVFQVLR